jgi:hypothetical protein
MPETKEIFYRGKDQHASKLAWRPKGLCLPGLKVCYFLNFGIMAENVWLSSIYYLSMVSGAMTITVKTLTVFSSKTLTVL